MTDAKSTFALISLVTAILLHPVHETFCEVEWNTETRRLEVALRLDVLDEQWLEKRWSTESTQSNWRSAYLTTHLFFDPVQHRATGDAATTDSIENAPANATTGRPLKWIGRKLDGAHVWWFFEVVCDDNLPPQTVQTRMLFDRESNYQHRLTVLAKGQPAGGKRPSVVLNVRQPAARIPSGL